MLVTAGPQTLTIQDTSGPLTIASATVGGATGDVKVEWSGSTPSEIITGPDGNLWLLDSLNGQIDVVATDGTFLHRYDANPAGSVRFLGSLTIGPDGFIWYTLSDGSGVDLLGRMDPADGSVQTFAIGTTNDLPLGITTGPDGDIWFTLDALDSVTGTNDIGQFDPSTPMVAPKLWPLSEGFDVNLGLIIPGPDGRLWFTEQSNQAIGAITTSGPNLGAIQEYNLSVDSSLTATFTVAADPAGIAVGPDGNIWFTVPSSGFLAAIILPGSTKVFSPGGTFTPAEGDLCHAD